jgi:hypothetical protein
LPNALGKLVDLLEDLEDVQVSGLSDGQSLMYDAGTSKWSNDTIDLSAYVQLDGETSDITNGSFSLTTTGTGTYNSGGPFETVIGDNTLGRSFYTSVGGREIIVADASGDRGLLVDDGTNYLSVLDGSGNITLSGNQNIFSTVARFDDALDTPTSYDFRVANTTEMILDGSELNLLSNDLVTTGEVKIESDIHGLLLGENGGSEIVETGGELRIDFDKSGILGDREVKFQAYGTDILELRDTGLLLLSQQTTSYGLQLNESGNRRCRWWYTGFSVDFRSDGKFRVVTDASDIEFNAYDDIFFKTQTGSGDFYFRNSSGDYVLIIDSSEADFEFLDGGSMTFGTSNGMEIGTGSSQKIGFWGTTPVAQPTTGVSEATFVENPGGTTVTDDSTFGGYTIAQITKALQDIGILA